VKKVFKDLPLSYTVTSLTFADKLLFLFLLVSALSGFFFVKKLFPSGDIVKIGLDNSPCPDKLCVKQGWTDRGAIICLPNKVIISVGEGDENILDTGYDAVTR
jgi:hypothetical protein